MENSWRTIWSLAIILALSLLSFIALRLYCDIEEDDLAGGWTVMEISYNGTDVMGEFTQSNPYSFMSALSKELYFPSKKKGYDMGKWELRDKKGLCGDSLVIFDTQYGLFDGAYKIGLKSFEQPKRLLLTSDNYLLLFEKQVIGKSINTTRIDWID
jgi:hypothetical protein